MLETDGLSKYLLTRVPFPLADISSVSVEISTWTDYLNSLLYRFKSFMINENQNNIHRKIKDIYFLFNVMFWALSSSVDLSPGNLHQYIKL
jgi:hypothetical protein